MVFFLSLSKLIKLSYLDWKIAAKIDPKQGQIVGIWNLINIKFKEREGQANTKVGA